MALGMATRLTTCGPASPGRVINSQAVPFEIRGPRLSTVQLISTVRNIGVDESCLTFISAIARSNGTDDDGRIAPPAAVMNSKEPTATAETVAPVCTQRFLRMFITSASLWCLPTVPYRGRKERTSEGQHLASQILGN